MMLPLSAQSSKQNYWNGNLKLRQAMVPAVQRLSVPPALYKHLQLVADDPPRFGTEVCSALCRVNSV